MLFMIIHIIYNPGILNKEAVIPTCWKNTVLFSKVFSQVIDSLRYTQVLKVLGNIFNSIRRFKLFGFGELMH